MRNLCFWALWLWPVLNLSAQFLPTAQEGRIWYSHYQGFWQGTEIYSVGPKINFQGSPAPLLLLKNQAGQTIDTLGVLVEDTTVGEVTLHYGPGAPQINPANATFSYSFSNSVGDTFSYQTIGQGAITLTIDSIYSYTDFRGITRRVQRIQVPALTFSTSTYFNIIEGLGPQSSWVNPIYDGSVSDNVGYTLRCVFDGGTKIYGDTVQQCFILNQPEVKQELAGFYPNPCKGRLYFTQAENFERYAILNQLGQVVQKGQIPQGALDVSALAAGTYLMQLTGFHSLSARQMLVKVP